MATTQFKTGQTYYTRSMCDHNVIFTCKVVGRTKQFITIKTHAEKTRRRKIYIKDGIEHCRPFGQYSMNPIINANSTRRPKADWEQ